MLNFTKQMENYIETKNTQKFWKTLRIIIAYSSVNRKEFLKQVKTALSLIIMRNHLHILIKRIQNKVKLRGFQPASDIYRLIDRRRSEKFSENFCG
jgi:hypothetical protein